MTHFATFWHGPLPPLIAACLTTFPARGARLTLFSYDPAVKAPPGITVADAREILPDPSLIERYRVAGRVSLATFADRFRYELLTQCDVCWVDADMAALRPEAISGPVVWGRQPEAKGKALINNAVLRLPAGDPVLADMRARARAAEGAEVSWGALGPYLLTEVAETHGADATASPPARFFAVAPDAFFTFFDPGSRDEVAAALRESDLAHLWCELLRRTAYDFDAAPPEGSWLHGAFAEVDALRLFGRVCEPAEIAALIARWRATAP